MKHFLYNDVSIISVWNFIDRKDSGHIFTKKKKLSRPICMPKLQQLKNASFHTFSKE